MFSEDYWSLVAAGRPFTLVQENPLIQAAGGLGVRLIAQLQREGVGNAVILGD